MRTGYKLMPRGVSQPSLLHSGRPHQSIVSVRLHSEPSECFIGAFEPARHCPVFCTQHRLLVSWKPMSWASIFIMPYSSFLQLPTFPPFLSQLLFLSLLEFYFLLIGFLGCVNFLRCTLLLIFLYLIRCYWSPNAYYLFWMFWGKLGWAGFSAYPLSSAGPSN